MSPHSNFLLKVIVSRCMASVEPNDESYKERTGKTEIEITGPMIDHLHAIMTNINFESVWHRRGLPPEEEKETVSNELGGDYVCLYTATDTFVADTRKGMTNKDLLIDSLSCRPGYTRLTPMKQSVWMLNAGERLDGKVYLKQLHMKRQKGATDKLDKMTCLLAFRCHWPEVAFEWLDRNRPHDWPPRSFISEIEEKGCRVVPLSHSFTVEKDIEWMFSFALAEKMLARDATSKIQRSCFQFLTLLMGNSLGNQSKITYFHLKSVFFYACERLNLQTWDQQPAFCVSEMIRYLMDGFEARFLPCYFVKSNNIIEDFTDSELMFHTEHLKTLHRHFFVSVYFMLDAKGQSVADPHSVFDDVVSDYQQYQDHRHLGTSIAECFLPCIEKHISLFTSSKFYNKMIDLASEASAELNTTFAYDITVKDLLLHAIQTLSLDKGWLCAFYVDQKLPLSLTDCVSEGLNTVSLLDFLGEEILSSVTSVGNDIRVPEELVTVDSIVPFITDFTKLLKDDLNLGSNIYITAWMFFVEMHLNSVKQFIRCSCVETSPEEKRLVEMKQRASILCLQNVLMTIRLELNDLNKEQSVSKLRDVEYYLKFLDGK